MSGPFVGAKVASGKTRAGLPRKGDTELHIRYLRALMRMADRRQALPQKQGSSP